MGFVAFLILLVISLVAAAVLFFGFGLNVRGGIVSFLSQWIVAYIGALIAPVIFGSWFEVLEFEGIYIIPALLGSFALVLLVVDIVKSFKASSAGASESNF